MNYLSLFKNNEDWINEKLQLDSDYFKKLSKGQNPEFLYIGCSDSRVSPEEFAGLKPGDTFVHRNIANLVVSIDLNQMAVINYAINRLKIKHIIVCGHYGCGGVKAAMEASDLEKLNPWLQNVKDVYRLHTRELTEISNSEERYKRLVELNVEEQCINLLKTHVVQKEFELRNIQIHAWVFDIQSGKIIDLNIDFEQKLKPLKEIYSFRN